MTPSVTSTRAVVVSRTGGPEVLELRDVELRAPQPGEVRVRHAAVGVNFLDVYYRTGLYSAPLPFTPGIEASGVVEALGEGVKSLAVGDRVAYATRPIGAYVAHRNLAADRVVRLPAHVDDETGAAVMLKGMTARYLLRTLFRVEAGHRVLVHAATGGVGTLLVPWARSLGAHVIAIVGSPDKVARAHELGAQDVVVRPHDERPAQAIVDLGSQSQRGVGAGSSTGFAARVREITSGRGVHVVYDSVGKDTLEASIECLGVRGMLVSYGQSSGPAAPLDLGKIAARSLFVTRPSLFDYTATREDLEASANDVFEALRHGVIRSPVERRYPLADAAQAHADLQSRRTTGASVLLP